MITFPTRESYQVSTAGIRLAKLITRCSTKIGQKVTYTSPISYLFLIYHKMMHPAQSWPKIPGRLCGGKYNDLYSCQFRISVFIVFCLQGLCLCTWSPSLFKISDWLFCLLGCWNGHWPRRHAILGLLHKVGSILRLTLVRLPTSVSSDKPYRHLFLNIIPLTMTTSMPPACQRPTAAQGQSPLERSVFLHDYILHAQSSVIKYGA